MRKSALFLFGLVVASLVALGLVVLSSASEANGLRLYNDPYFFMKRQFAFLFLGIFVATGAALFDYRRWRDHKFLPVLAYAGVLVLLLLVFGYRAVNGSQRWIILGPIRVQPSEFAKLVTVIVTAVWMDRAGWHAEQFKRGALCPAILIAILCGPVLFQPDFGSVMVMGASGLLVMFVAGTRVLHLLPVVSMGVLVFIYKLVTNANRMRRLMGYFSSHGQTAASSPSVVEQVVTNVTAAVHELDPAAYQAQMSRVAIQNGGVFGVGLGESMQKHLYLPEAHTDFIFSVGAEELGVFFSLVVIGLFVMFFVLSIYVARKSADRFGRYLVMGMMFIIFFQASFNLGVVCEALPTKGMALPFFSYGGTNLLSAFFAVGTILSVGIHSSKDPKRKLSAKSAER